MLEQTQFADEITKVLTKLSFEIKTEIRFIPNEAGKRGDDEEGSPGTTRTKLPKPEVVAQVSVKDWGIWGAAAPPTPTKRKTFGAPPRTGPTAPNPGRRGREDT